MQNTIKPGTPVILTEPLHRALADIPAGTFGIIETCDLMRSEATVQFIGHIVQREVPLPALRKVARLHVGVRAKSPEQTFEHGG